MPSDKTPARRTGADVIDRKTIVSESQTPAARVHAEQAAVRPPEIRARRVVIDHIAPNVDSGRFPIKRTIGERVRVIADVFADGHEELAVVLRDRHSAGNWRETRMTPVAPGSDQWEAEFELTELGWHEYAVTAWVDRFRTWRRDLKLKADAGQDVSLDLLEGSLIVREAAARAEQIGIGGPDSHWLLARADVLSDGAPLAERLRIASDDELLTRMDIYADRSQATESEPLRAWSDRERARFSTWYEMFPRSAGPDATRSGTFREACTLLPAISDLGFDIVYLPPIHPIGVSFRKGANNRVQAAPGDPGSPWAIGSDEGGHTAIEPGLGTLEDFEVFRAEAERLGMEIALDLAWQASPDHPWVGEHPEWFRHRPDGTVKYAENPPKKYQDIYPFDFANEEWPSLWIELLNVTLLWVARGVRAFRVDNPHTKTFGFWEWLIDEVHRRDPRIIFLSEAFTRPKPMHYLAKAGFTQSYTHFTWKNTKAELTEYFTELAKAGEYFRPNLFTNTPDILHAYLQEGGRPAFEARLLLAATLGASYGIYSGFELAEGRAVPGTEEYADSEKYQYRKWDWDRSGHIKELVARVNRLRRRHRALQFDSTLRFVETDNPQIIAYTKSDPYGDETLLTVVNLDPHFMQHGFVRAPDEWAIERVGADRFYNICDLIDETSYAWRGEWNYVRLDPGVRQGHILKLEIKN